MFVFTIELLAVFFILAFICEFIDSSIGGGYGTILTPVALSLGINPLVIIPAILFSEIFTGFLGGFSHHYFKNVDFKIVGVDALFGFVGISIGVLSGIALPPIILKAWIGTLVLVCGIVLLLNLKGHYLIKGSFKLRNDIPLTLICSFNKGMSGGGYGPLSTTGLMVVRANPKKAVGSTILSEGVVCLMGFIMYMMLGKASLQLNPLTICITIAACLAVFPAAYVTHKLNSKLLKAIVGVFVTVLGVWTLLKIII